MADTEEHRPARGCALGCLLSLGLYLVIALAIAHHLGGAP